jgi:hypothetical protein
MKAIYGLCSHPALAQHTVDSLRQAGVKDDAIVVVASQPHEEYEFSHRYKKTWLFWIAAGGGALGMLAGLALAYITEARWPLVTGGMPIVAWWPNIIILFELTMLGSIVATVVSLLIMTELPNLRSRVYDPEVSQGKILVAVENPDDADVAALEKTFKVSGIEEIKTV